MRYRLLRQLQEPNGVVRCKIDAPPPIGTGIDIQGDIIGHVELSNTGRSVVARGRVAGEADLVCSRCLRHFRWQFDIDFTENCALHQADDPAEYETEAEDEDLIPILDEDVIDLSELIRQLIVVEAPLRPLCRPDCAGLCPKCGADLNNGECGCTKDAIDPRWAKLKELLED